MMKIGICNQLVEDRNQIKQLCDCFFENKQEQIQFIEFESSEELIKELDDMDILFLDTKLDFMNGVQVKNYLEMRGSHSPIIFTSDSRDEIEDAFGIHVIGFLVKPINTTCLFQCMERLWNYKTEAVLKYEVDTTSGKVNIPIQHIIYIASYGHYCDVISMNKKFRVRKSLREVEEELPSAMFFRCHRSYIVNVALIVKLGKRIRMINDHCIDVSRNKYAELEERYADIVYHIKI